MKFRWSSLRNSAVLLTFFFALAGFGSAQDLDPCAGALFTVVEGPSALGSATGCGVIITVTAVDSNGSATAFSITVPNNGNGNPYDGADDTLVGVINNSGSALTAIPITLPDITFGGAFGFNQDGPCDFGSTNHDGSQQDCFTVPEGAQQYGYEGPDNYFSNLSGVSCNEDFTCYTTGIVNFTDEEGLGNGLTSWFALEGTPQSLSLGPQGGNEAVLTFTPAQPFAVATFNCTSGLTPCPDQGAHSMKFSINTVIQSFSITLLAVEEDGDGVCESGIPGDPNDPIDCRFVTFFGEPVMNSTAINVPLCYAYSSSAPTGTKHCVYYSVQGAPPTTGFYTGPVLETIAWNTLETPPAGFVNSPRMYDDPSDDANNCKCYPIIPGFPYSPEDNQFVFDITTFFNPNPGTVGTDPSTGGKTLTFNDFVIAFPRTTAQVQQPVNADGSSIFNGNRGVVPLKFNLIQDGVATCSLPAATLTLSRLVGGTPGAVDEGLYSMSADSGSNFRISGCQYIYNLAASSVGPGEYKAGLVIGNEVVGTAFFEVK